MKRLRDEIDSTDRRLARDARLLSAARSFQPSEIRKRRVLAGLVREPRRPWGAFLLRPAVIAILLLGLVGIAGATVGRNLVRQLVVRLQEAAQAPVKASPKPSPDAIPPARHEAPPAAGNSPIAPLPTPDTPPPTAPRSIELPPAQAMKTTRQKAISLAPKHADPASVIQQKAPGALENAVVLDAVNALRRDHDPARAAMLLTFYLQHQPDGALAEEALALAMEADRAAGGTGTALAEQYLKRYPTGRYRELARLTRERAGSAK